METNWIIITLVLVSVIILIVYLIIRNQKDKDEMMQSFDASDKDMPDNKDESEL